MGKILNRYKITKKDMSKLIKVEGYRQLLDPIQTELGIKTTEKAVLTSVTEFPKKKS